MYIRRLQQKQDFNFGFEFFSLISRGEPIERCKTQNDKPEEKKKER